ncbi:hypothetical protein [Streptomyces sp. NPDC019937]|uniref:hypothetical protein n=1 Tax=Streptomyces sp. NPDC019937 TaxID=3154787 RepID=UPI0033CE7D61
MRADGGGARHLRLSYSYPSPEDIREGADRLAGVLREALPLAYRYWDVLSGTCTPSA